MGTRHMIGVVQNGEFKVGQYGQWDGYPGGQGVDILKFLQTADLEKFSAEVSKLRFMTDEDEAEMKAAWKAVGADDSGWVTMEQSDALYKNPKFAALSRDVGASVLTMIQDGSVEFLVDNSSFAEKSLFCEWAYVIDLDENTFEVYEGFQQTAPKAGRWAGVHPEGEGYAAVELREVWNLSDLPSEDAFLEALEEE